jgi:hypothetical protein
VLMRSRPSLPGLKVDSRQSYEVRVVPFLLSPSIW